MLLATAVYLFIADRDRLDYTRLLSQGLNGTFLWIVWISLAVDILYRLIPNQKTAIGARKHFACSYDAATPVQPIPRGPAETTASGQSLPQSVQTKQPHEQVEPTASDQFMPQTHQTDSPDCHKKTRLHKGAFLSAVTWIAVTGMIFLIFYGLGSLTPAAAVLVALLYAVCDLVFILFFCPFQVLFMRNRCCASCRIYNWDCLMMCAPLILFPHAYSVSLFLLSAAALFLWERALRRHPHFFLRETNKNLRCERCEEKLCTFLKIPSVQIHQWHE